MIRVGERKLCGSSGQAQSEYPLILFMVYDVWVLCGVFGVLGKLVAACTCRRRCSPLRKRLHLRSSRPKHSPSRRIGATTSPTWCSTIVSRQDTRTCATPFITNSRCRPFCPLYPLCLMALLPIMAMMPLMPIIHTLCSRSALPHTTVCGSALYKGGGRTYL